MEVFLSYLILRLTYLKCLLSIYLNSHTSICYLVKEQPWEMSGKRNYPSENTHGNSHILCESWYKSFNSGMSWKVCVCKKGREVISSWLRKGKNNLYPFLWLGNSTLAVMHSLEQPLFVPAAISRASDTT